MGRLLVAVSGALFGAALFAAGAAPAATHGGWLPTLGALALGGLLGSLFGGSGFGAAFILTLLAVVSVLALRQFGKTRREPAASLQLAGPGAKTVAAPKGPAGFDAAGLLRCAKLNYVKLQAARELGRLEPVREFTTAEMYHRLEVDGSARPSDVVELNADLLEVGAEAGRQQASVRFSGMARAAPGAVPVGFVEVWSLAKPADGASGWLLAGIPQMR
ncbi:MAG: Tim44 domain-containing protein [Burkholderiales bacterium]